MRDIGKDYDKSLGTFPMEEMDVSFFHNNVRWKVFSQANNL